MQFISYLHDIERTVRLIRATNEDLGCIVAPNTDEGPDLHEENVSPEFALHTHLNITQDSENASAFTITNSENRS
ncbi:hypothetical protein DPMN_083064 [Dreissena polymorpha]|uniref:Uncharacterized protein n=1 Tax=Dreissena polymorpha TaxID=45954 RepID=A0A9D3Y987_DREPO|nr:hypothetical protein DPMN_083064 [Dreissena polymorpha]